MFTQSEVDGFVRRQAEREIARRAKLTHLSDQPQWSHEPQLCQKSLDIMELNPRDFDLRNQDLLRRRLDYKT